VAGVIGTETNFELLLPDEWNGKFVMGGGGGFVGSVINTALGYGVLQKGYATVGTTPDIEVTLSMPVGP
jgi:feruloyl esterase